MPFIAAQYRGLRWGASAPEGSTEGAAGNGGARPACYARLRAVPSFTTKPARPFGTPLGDMRVRRDNWSLALAAFAMLAATVSLAPIGASGQTAGCAPDLPHLRAASCPLVRGDDGSARNPTRRWGRIDCQRRSRHDRLRPGGDKHAKADASPQRNRSYRRLRVVNGDDVFGERCELGRNDWRDEGNRTFALYREGEARMTFLSLRLPKSFPLGVRTWQPVMQMKQTQPSANGGGSPVLTLHAADGRWRLFQSSSSGPASGNRLLWSAPASKRTWTRFAFDVRYSTDPQVGFVKVYIDLNRDHDALDRHEQSPAFRTFTLKRETAGGWDEGIATGQPIPSHLRVGIYHDRDVRCPGPRGCMIDLDNVQVLSR